MCTDKHTATGPDTDAFILMGPCSDLCRTVMVNGWVCPLFSSLLVSFPAIFPCRWKKTLPDGSFLADEDFGEG